MANDTAENLNSERAADDHDRNADILLNIGTGSVEMVEVDVWANFIILMI